MLAISPAQPSTADRTIKPTTHTSLSLVMGKSRYPIQIPPNTTATTSLNKQRTGGGTSFKLRDAKFINAPHRPAANGSKPVEAGQSRFTASGLLIIKAPITHTANCNGQPRG